MYHEYLDRIKQSLAHLSSDQLKELLNDDDQLEEKVNEVLASFQARRENMLKENREMAEQNIIKEPQLTKVRKHVDQLREERNKSTQALQKLSQSELKSGKIDLEGALTMLSAAAAESEESSENSFKNFMGNDITVDAFLGTFLTDRKLMHLRKIKCEKMSELMRRRNSSQNNNYVPGNDILGSSGGFFNYFPKSNQRMM